MTETKDKYDGPALNSYVPFFGSKRQVNLDFHRLSINAELLVMLKHLCTHSSLPTISGSNPST